MDLPFWARKTIIGSDRIDNKFDREIKLFWGRRAWEHIEAAYKRCNLDIRSPPAVGYNIGKNLTRGANEGDKSALVGALPEFFARYPDTAPNNPLRNITEPKDVQDYGHVSASLSLMHPH